MFGALQTLPLSGLELSLAAQRFEAAKSKILVVNISAFVLPASTLTLPNSNAESYHYTQHGLYKMIEYPKSAQVTKYDLF